MAIVHHDESLISARIIITSSALAAGGRLRLAIFGYEAARGAILATLKSVVDGMLVLVGLHDGVLGDDEEVPGDLRLG